MLGAGFFTGVVRAHRAPHSHAQAPGRSAAALVPVPQVLAAARVHRGATATLQYWLSGGTKVRRVIIVVRAADGSPVRTVVLGPQPSDRRLSYRFAAQLALGRYTWSVSATAGALTGTSARSGSLTVLAPLPPAFPRTSAVAAALRWARARVCRVGVAVMDSRGHLHGYHDQRQFQSASLSKAMLLVAYLRRHPQPGEDARETLTAMIEESDDASADAIFAEVGNAGLLRVAKLAGMRHFATGYSWIAAQVTAADQARFFYRYEHYLPARSVAFARSLLGGITPIQRWGIPAAAGPDGWRVYFKGGWLGEDNDAVTQAAWLRRGHVRWALSVLTADDPTNAYGWQTLKGITGLLLGHEPTAAYLAVVHESDAEDE
jgi:hypothetical protein